MDLLVDEYEVFRNASLRLLVDCVDVWRGSEGTLL